MLILAPSLQSSDLIQHNSIVFTHRHNSDTLVVSSTSKSRLIWTADLTHRSRTIMDNTELKKNIY